ncbi:MAG: hypothetical protein H6735_12885 [Alphaproteobacteria bacterium]|nr:hypothetical protein [Alphaproteobacteria bacterium]
MILLSLWACAATTTPSDDAEVPAVNGRLEHQGERDVLYLWGSRYEMGYAEGTLTCHQIGPLFKHYLVDFMVGEYSSYSYADARLLVLGSAAFEPGEIEEIQGYFDGASDACTAEQLTIDSPDAFVEPYHLQVEDLLFANAAADFGCSSFTVWGDASTTGDTIHGRNFDWIIDPEGTFIHDHLLKVYDSVDEDARFASVMLPAMAGCVSCVTDEVVSATLHDAPELPASQMVGISARMLATRSALLATIGASDPVAAVEDVLEARPQISGSNIHLAMPMARNGGQGGVVLEMDGERTHPDGQVTVRRAGEDSEESRTDVTLAANHYAKRRIDLGDPDTNGRVETLAAMIDTAPVGADDAGTLLDAVKNGYSGITAHSIVVDTANRELRLYVADEVDRSATEGVSTNFDLDVLFDHVRELSGL